MVSRLAQAAAIHLPRTLRIGAGASLALPEVLRALRTTRPLICTDDFIHKSGLMQPMLDTLSEHGIESKVFSGCIPDPTTDSLDAGVDAAKDCDVRRQDQAQGTLAHRTALSVPGCFSTRVAQVVVGFGGGSSLDSAKAIAVLACHGGPLRRFKVPAEAPVGLPVVAVPTTAGTGSEVTRVAIVTDSETQEKMLCLGPGMLADAALVDFELSMAKPYRLTADSGLDTLCHALEAYVSRKANAFTDQMALSSMRSVVDNLPAACADPNDRQARESLMLAATQGGIAFSNASVTLIHGMSRPLGAAFHVPHGLSNAILLPSITEWSLPGAEQRYAECARALGYASDAQSDAEALAGLMGGLRGLLTSLKVPTGRPNPHPFTLAHSSSPIHPRPNPHSFTLTHSPSPIHPSPIHPHPFTLTHSSSPIHPPPIHPHPFTLTHSPITYHPHLSPITYHPHPHSHPHPSPLPLALTLTLTSLQVPTLVDLGVPRAQFTAMAPRMAEQALASGSPANNPRVPDAAQVVRLYQAIYDEERQAASAP